MRPGTYRSNYPGDDIKHSTLQYLHGIQFMAAGLNAQAQGFDAYALSMLPEPALHNIRSLLQIPVVGYGESAMLTACMLGRRFGVLVFIDELADLVTENAAHHGLSQRLAAVRHEPRPRHMRFSHCSSGQGLPDGVSCLKERSMRAVCSAPLVSAQIDRRRTRSSAHGTNAVCLANSLASAGFVICSPMRHRGKSPPLARRRLLTFSSPRLISRVRVALRLSPNSSAVWTWL